MVKRKSKELLKQNARIHQNTMEFNKQQSEIRKEKMTKTKYLGSGDCGQKDRWECPHCRIDPDKPECRFNLSRKKRGKTHPCRYCGEKLLLEVTNGS